MSKKCLVCNYIDNDNEISTDFGDVTICNCPKCGKYKISGTAQAVIEYKAPNSKLSSWISEQHKVFKEDIPYIDSTKLDAILNQRGKTIREKFECFMRTMLYINDMNLKADMFNHCYIKDKNELEQLIEKAIKENYFKAPPKTPEKLAAHFPFPSSYNFYGLTFEGREYIESLNEPNKNSNKIFIAFWFNDDMKKVFDDVVIPRINETEFRAERVSSKTTSHDQYISDDIIGKIKSSRAVVADCTGNRTAVYYEAGFAMGMKIPVFWTCKEGIDPDESSNKTHMEQRCFDINQYPCIVWKDAEDLSRQLIERLRRDL
ncbi:MAG: hypothetical protein PHO27_09580 [Sulfuricurvum sp.]|nr:hypothetical protein [Sulfuricurvum sp.]